MSGSIHRLSASEALASLRSTIDGLTSTDAHARQREFGANQLTRVRQRPVVFNLIAQLTHFFSLILWAAAA